MVKTWESAWFGEDGTRLLYLVPRTRTDELLPLTVDPKPAEVVRVLVGRHDFLTPEQEAVTDRQMARIRAAQAELNAAEQELRKLGRFSLPSTSISRCGCGAMYECRPSSQMTFWRGPPPMPPPPIPRNVSE